MVADTRRGRKRSMRRIASARSPNDPRDEQQEQRRHDAEDEDHAPLPRVEVVHPHQVADRRSASTRPRTRNSGTSTTVAPSSVHHAMRFVRALRLRDLRILRMTADAALPKP